MKSSFYFKHDLDARDDGKMRAFLIKHGATGYGIYWMVVEDLYRNKGRLERDYKALSWAYHQPQQRVKAVVEECAMFYDAKGKIASRRVDRDLVSRRESSEKARAAGKASAVQRSLNKTATVSQPGEERKGEERKGEREEAATPSLFQIQEYAKQRGSAVDPERFFNYYAAVGWVKSGSPIVDWKAVFDSWEKTERPSPAKDAEKAKELRCKNCTENGNWAKRDGLCAVCLEHEAVRMEGR